MARRLDLAVLPDGAPQPEVFRRFFLTGIAAMLTAGGSLGAVVLIRIAAHHSFTSVPIFDINAHAQAQIYGWVGMFVMGFSYQAFPRFWGTRLALPRLALVSWVLMVAGVLLRAFGEPFHATPALAAAALAGGTAQLAAASMYATVLFATARSSRQPRSATDRYIGAAVVWFVLAAGLDLFHLARTLAAPTAAALVRQVEIWQFPLRDLQIQGVAMMMIFAVSLRQFPIWFGTPLPDQRRARRLWLPLQLAVITEVVAFVVAMATRAYVWMAAYGVATVALLVCAALYVVNLRTWARTPTPDRSLKFVRAAQAWLLVALAMLVVAPAYFALVGMPFSHAWYGAMRHAVTVGFISLTIVGVAAKVVSAHAAPWAPRLGDLWLPFVLVNAGCVLRVVMQVATDFTAGAFPIASASGVLEVAGFAVWGFELARRMLAGYRRAADVRPEAGA
ncbi:MAG: NnrS family protein [Thermoanaerobaculaceae bacterium]|nr:NnrS family protein [Thermoanaerobaculaceae bacterium]